MWIGLKTSTLVASSIGSYAYQSHAINYGRAIQNHSQIKMQMMIRTLTKSRSQLLLKVNILSHLIELHTSKFIFITLIFRCRKWRALRNEQLPVRNYLKESTPDKNSNLKFNSNEKKVWIARSLCVVHQMNRIKLRKFTIYQTMIWYVEIVLSIATIKPCNVYSVIEVTCWMVCLKRVTKT